MLSRRPRRAPQPSDSRAASGKPDLLRDREAVALIQRAIFGLLLLDEGSSLRASVDGAARYRLGRIGAAAPQPGG